MNTDIKSNKQNVDMNKDIAEFIGIFIGDGSLNIREEKHSYEFKFTGNKKDEIPYFREHVSKLASKILHRKIENKFLDGGRSIGLYFCSKDLAFYLKDLGITSGPKSAKIEIPLKIIQKRKWAIACMRGIFDTDGCFTLKKGHSYPVITFAMKSKKLMFQMRSILKTLDIRCCLSLDVPYFDSRTNKVYIKHYLSINGIHQTHRWFDIVGTNNPKNIKKYKDYLKNKK